MTTPSNHNTQPAAASADCSEVLRLASALVDGVLSGDGQADLERLLLASPTARDAFRGFMRAESILAWELAGGDASVVQSQPEPVRASRFALPMKVPMMKVRKGTPRNAGTRLTRKNGNSGTSRRTRR